jgi:beta-glucosidase
MRRCSWFWLFVLNGGLLLAASCGHSEITSNAQGSSSAGTSPSNTGLIGSLAGSSSLATAGNGLASETSKGSGGSASAFGNGGSGFVSEIPKAGSSATEGAAGSISVTGECPAATMPAEATRPGYTAARDPGVTALLSSMSLDNKIKQMYGIPNPPTRSGVYNDIERSQDVPGGTGKTVRGLKYRDAGRGVNLAAGQIDRTSQGKDYATAFPCASIRAASFDPDLEMQTGEALGDETMVSKNNILLAPCMNIIRHPFWGRTQETYGEDMYHVGRMAAALSAGIQKHVIACAKHYAANNVENNRANQNAQMDEQTLREIYARHFGMVAQEGGVGCVMAAYNSINGKKSTQNKHLLKDILKGSADSGGFGFRGFVLTDWWAMPGDQTAPDAATAQAQALEAVQAGLDLEVPWALNYSQLGALVSSGKLTQAEIDESVGRILEQKFRFGTTYTDQPFGLGTATTTLTGDSITNNESHLALAEEIEIKSAVLLTNGMAATPVLPISNVTSVAVVGLDMPISVTSSTEVPKTGAIMHFATDANIGDRGSSRVNADPAKSIGPYAGIKTVASSHGISNVTSGNSVAAAQTADFVVVVVGLTAGNEGEEYSIASHGDRTTLSLPGAQEKLISDVLALDKPTAIIIESGSIVNVPWLSHANQKQATIWAGYGGQHVGLALGKLLFGDRNFSGKMPLAWPNESDMPSFRETGTTTEMGYFFGYRDYDNRKANGNPLKLVFPFGHGLSYTTFSYSNLIIPCASVSKTGVVNITADITNTGSVDGDEIMMMFVAGPPKPAGITGNRPVKELKRFQRVSLKASGQSGSDARVTFPLDIQDLRHWEGDANGSWVVDEGTYTIMVGPSGDDDALKLKGTLTVHK